LLAPFSTEQRSYTQGALTVLIESAQIPAGTIPDAVSAMQPGCVGVRRPAYAALQALLSQLGGLVWATSANAAGEVPAVTEEQVQRWVSRLAKPPELVITSMQSLRGRPSDLVQLRENRLIPVSR
jgi:tRNA A37 threonylcarbamoyladenosine synthetase subunit TsaC/SUA5/YrdC